MGRKQKTDPEVLPEGFSKHRDGLRLRFYHSDKRYVVYGQTVEECYEKKKLKCAKVDEQIEDRENPKVKQYVEKWEARRVGQVGEATLRTQAKVSRVILAMPIESAGVCFGDIRMQNVKADDIYELQSKLLQGCFPEAAKITVNVRREEKRRGTQTVNDYLAYMKHIFRDAKRERVIDYNPFEAVRNLKRTEERARDTYHRALTQAEQTAFFQSDRAKESAYYNVFRLAILTGMRCGEIGALRNSDIKNGNICVQRTVTRNSFGYCIGETAKTKAGKRTIPLTDQIREVLADQRAQNEILYGNVIDPRDTIFKAPQGGILIATPADREIKRICEKVGIEPFTMHAFRDTYATRAIESGMNPKTLQEIMGHTNFNLTMSLYGHAMDDTKKKEAELVRIIM